jgi:hypothetical protein
MTWYASTIAATLEPPAAATSVSEAFPAILFCSSHRVVTDSHGSKQLFTSGSEYQEYKLLVPGPSFCPSVAVCHDQSYKPLPADLGYPYLSVHVVAAKRWGTVVGIQKLMLDLLPEAHFIIFITGQLKRQHLHRQMGGRTQPSLKSIC